MKEPLFESKRAKMMEIFHQDGIVDLIGGAVLLNYGFDLLNNSSLSSLFTYIPILLMTPMKMQVTISRLGYEPFNNSQKKVRQWILGAAALMVLTLMLLGMVVLNPVSAVSVVLNNLFEDYGGLVGVGITLAVVSALAAVLTPHKRFLIYTITPLAAAIAALALRLPVYALVFVQAAVMLGFGLRLMMRFTRAYPLETPSEKKKK